MAWWKPRMEGKLLRKLIKVHGIDELVAKHGFFALKRTMAVRVHENVLQVICFEVTSSGFRCKIAMQPLYISSAYVHLSFGNELTSFRTALPRNWGYGGESTTKVELNLAKYLIEKNVLPWFEEYGSPKGLIEFIQSGKADGMEYVVVYRPMLRKELLGYSLLYEKRYTEAYEPLNQARQQAGDRDIEWIHQYKHNLDTLLRHIDHKEHAEIDQILQDNIAYTRSQLRLPE